VWANIWYQDFIVRIDPDTGVVNSIVDLSGLYAGQRSRDEVLNGIAWDEVGQRLFVTGKLWPNIFEIKIKE
jgi:glutamine cyclotransferase